MNNRILSKKALAFLLILMIFSCSCDLFKNNSIIKEIDVTIAYKTPIYTGTNGRLEIENNIAYLYEVESDGMCAINLDNGNVIWRKKNFFPCWSNPVVIGEKVYFMKDVPFDSSEPTEILELIKETGEYVNKYTLGSNSSWRVRMFSIDGYKGKLYWGNDGGRNPTDIRGLVYFDTVTKEYGFCYRCGRLQIMNNIIAEDNVIYLVKSYSRDDFPDYEPSNPEYYPVLVALKTDETDDNGEYKVKWELKDIACGMFPRNNAIIGNKIYVISGGMICIDKETGKIIWRNEEYNGQTTYYKGRFYSQSVDYTGYKFYCLDANTGETIWKIKLDGELYKYSDSCDINPQVNEGYVYYITDNYMIVVDDRRGCVVSVDPKVRAGLLSTGISVRYKDLMLFKSLEGYLYAVKMDMHRRGL
ncbi:MAG TPA: PQQ-binding-like beta-propeller repeat protein [Spirochaetota bacterium]|nr:PQQ-binding-like beta-propeller repeat protein [Spirochaetota bacterium]HOL57228.1 PQQ-binding-like beta-propeller repeat protein [Spirochaetota bacterium]HPP04955.1 PQQ-binding-like beta-propeller repeat protein [Spirochaetota bacterium]